MTFPQFSHPDRFGYLNCTEKCALECVADVLASKMDTFNSNKSRQDNNNRHMK